MIVSPYPHIHGRFHESQQLHRSCDSSTGGPILELQAVAHYDFYYIKTLLSNTWYSSHPTAGPPSASRDFVTREAAVDKQYGKIHIPAGTAIMAAVEYIHRDPRHWENPDQFNPDR
ncbi:hypothetical protein HPB50_025217 [Hyalomma asiaticum]|uniref:Uncharacterized protein n=1 Tax=Hyalomma asiaticum TaxID=266040 RepID=A0ACB7S3P2_HYAAI|nr:hypothetical protein HPB50_025217 [Hyalomma asiaticum]